MTLLMIFLSLTVAVLYFYVYLLWTYEKANNKWAHEYSTFTEEQFEKYANAEADALALRQEMARAAKDLNDIVDGFKEHLATTRRELAELRRDYEAYRNRHRDEPES